MKPRNTKRKVDFTIKNDKLNNKRKEPQNKENRFPSKRNFQTMNTQVNKKEDQQSIKNQLSVIHLLIKKELERIRLDGHIMKLKAETDKTALIREEKREELAKAVGRRLQVEIGEKKTEERINIIEKEKQTLNESYIVKNLEFQKKEEESAEIKRKDEELRQIKLTIDGELKKLSEDKQILNIQYETINKKKQEYIDKVNKHNSDRIEILTSTLVLKPLIKRIAVIRKAPNTNVRIEKNRKELYVPSIPIDINYSFNYIISTIDNRLQTKIILNNENDYLHNEVANIVYGYLTHDIDYLLVLYQTSFPDVNSVDNINHIIQLMSQKDIFEFQYKIYSDNKATIVNSLNEIRNRNDVDYISVDLKKDRITKISIIIANYQNKDIKTLLTVFNELNTKRKKTKNKSTFCIPSMSILIQHLNSLNVNSPFPTLIIHDALASNLNNDTLSI